MSKASSGTNYSNVPRAKSANVWNAADREYHRELCRSLVKQNRYIDLDTLKQNAVGVGNHVRDPYAPGRAPILIRNFLEGRIDVIDFLMDAETIAPEQWVYDVEYQAVKDEVRRAGGDVETRGMRWAWRTFCFIIWSGVVALPVAVVWGTNI